MEGVPLTEALANRDKVLRAFVRPDGRIEQMPAKASKRLVILNLVAQAFDPGRRYTEQEVNETVLRYFDDYASLRRYLVDAGFLSRENGVYWRSGGTVDA